MNQLLALKETDRLGQGRKPITSKLSSHHLNANPSTIMSKGSQEQTIGHGSSYDRVNSGHQRDVD